MTYTSHGHRIPGSPGDDEQPPSRARCGGPGLCTQCSKEAASFAVTEENRKAFEEDEAKGPIKRNVFDKEE